MINPKFSEFIEENPKITMLSLAWSLYWRIAIVIFIVAFAIGVIAEL